MTLGKYLKEARKKSGMTQRRVADHFGWATSQYVSNWERDKTYPALYLLPDLAALYHLDYTDLANRVAADALKRRESFIVKGFGGELPKGVSVL